MRTELKTALDTNSVETREKQQETALEFVHQTEILIGSSNPYSQEYIQETRRKIKHDGNSDPSEIAANVFDVCLSDEIQVHEGELPLFRDQASVYYRSDMTRSILVQTLTSDLGIKIDDDEVVLACDSNFIHHYYPNKEFLQLSQQAGLLVLKEDEVHDPVCALEKHTLVQIMISLGINPLDKFHKPDTQITTKVDFYPTKEKIFKASLIEELNKEDMPFLEAGAENYWEKILNSPCLIFNSGTMANECVMTAVSRLGRNTSSYRDVSWYYENEFSHSNLFPKGDSPEDTTVYFSNLEPTNHFNLGSDEPLGYTKPYQMFKYAIEKAVKDPKQTIYLILDCTVDPLFLLPQSMPDNLVFIKTISSTKHQKGDRRFFSGVCSISANDNNLLHAVEAEIKQARDETGSHARKATLIHFPTPTIGWLEEKRKRVNNLNTQVSQIVNKQKHGWTAYPFSYHIFLVPPREIVKKVRNLTGLHLEQYQTDISSQIREVLVRHTEDFQNPHFEVGDSFGLPITRLHSQGGFSQFDDGKKFRIKIPRICFGYTTDKGEAVTFTKKLVKQLGSIK